MSGIKDVKRGTVRTAAALALCVYAAGLASEADACGTCQKGKAENMRVTTQRYDRYRQDDHPAWYRQYPTYRHYPYDGRRRESCGGDERDGWKKMAYSLARSRQERAREIAFDLPPGEYRWRAESHGGYVQYVSIRGRGGNSADASGNSQGPLRDGRVNVSGTGPVIGEGMLRGPDRLRISISHSSEPYGSRTDNLWNSPDLDGAIFQACSSESFCFRTEDMVTDRGGFLTPTPDSDRDFDDAILCIERVR